MLTDLQEVMEILQRSAVVFLAIHDQPAPYIVPLFFGCEEGRLYAHSRASGTKIDLIRVDPRVGFTATSRAEVVEGKTACDFTAATESVSGNGTARIIENEEERLHGLEIIMRHYAEPGSAQGFTYRPASFSRTAVIAVEIQRITGKRIGPRASSNPSPDH